MEAAEPTRSQFETTAQHLVMQGWPLQFNTVSYRKSTFRFLCSGMENSPLMLIQRYIVGCLTLGDRHRITGSLVQLAGVQSPLSSCESSETVNKWSVSDHSDGAQVLDFGRLLALLL